MSGGKKGWDLTSLHSCEGGAEWIRKNAGALLVLVVRPEDVAVALDPQIAPRDVPNMVEFALEGVVDRLEEQRLEARARAKIKKFQGEMQR